MARRARRPYSRSMIRVGRKAPRFELSSSEGTTRRLTDYAGRTLVLFFYPRDNTPGCTTEALEFTSILADLEKMGAVAVGVNKDSITAHAKFIDKHDLGVELLSDPDGKMLEAYDAWGEKILYGKKSMGIIRSTVVVDPAGLVAIHYPKVRARGHAAKVLDDLAEVVDLGPRAARQAAAPARTGKARRR